MEYMNLVATYTMDLVSMERHRLLSRKCSSPTQAHFYQSAFKRYPCRTHPYFKKMFVGCGWQLVEMLPVAALFPCRFSFWILNVMYLGFNPNFRPESMAQLSLPK